MRTRKPSVSEQLGQMHEDLHELLKRTQHIEHQGRTIMAQNAELNRVLDQMNEVTNELAADIADLLANQNNNLDPADRAKAEAVVARLQGLAASHTVPVPPVEPPA